MDESTVGDPIETAKPFSKVWEPVISVDTKKKERVGNFKNSGQKRYKKGEAPKVNIHDFPSLAEGTAIPHGTCDGCRNEGMVNVGMTDDTPEFAVASIRSWWHLCPPRGEQRRPEPGLEILSVSRQWST